MAKKITTEVAVERLKAVGLLIEVANGIIYLRKPGGVGVERLYITGIGEVSEQRVKAHTNRRT